MSAQTQTIRRPRLFSILGNEFKKNKAAIAANIASVRTSRWLVAATLFSCMVGASLISLLGLMHQSLRLDESQSLWQSSHSLAGVFHTVALDVHVPLYHVLLHFWIFYFGDGVVTIRIISLLFFLATIPVIYLLGRQILSRNWALFATVLFSFSPFMTWYASEARMYTLLVFMASLNLYYFIRLLKTGKGWWGFAITALLGAYSHYFFLFCLASEGLFYLFNARKFKPGSLKRFALVAVLVVAALGPWLYYVHSLGSASATRPHLPTPSTVDFFNVYSQFIFGFQTNHINTILLSSWPVIMLLALVAVSRGRKIAPAVSLVATMAVLPVVLAYVVSITVTPFFLSRYMIASVAPLLLLLLWFISNYAKRAAVIVGTLLVIATGLGSYQQAVSAATPLKENYSQVAADISAKAQPQDLVVLSAPFTIYPFEYYYNGTAQIQTLPNWDRVHTGAIPAFSSKTLPAEVAAQNADHRYIYLVLSQDQGYEKNIQQYYLTHFRQVSHHVYSDDLTLYVYQVGYYTVPAL